MPQPAPTRPGVLVVDDEPHVRQVARLALEGEGFRVWDAATPAEALALYREVRGGLDVLLLDVRLGRDSGPALLGDIQAQGPAPPAVFMTGSAGDDPLQGAAVLRKPFGLRQLAEAVRGAMAGPPRGSPAGSWG